MLTRLAGGNISGEATTQSGNIFPEAMRTLYILNTACARGTLATRAMTMCLLVVSVRR
jgi:hypothetical protein